MMTTEQFTKRLVNLCLRSGLAGMPKDITDQHILFKSAVLMMPDRPSLTEMEVNEKLQFWLTQVCVIKNFDRVTLRRWLVDSGYLMRDPSGTSYRVAAPGAALDLFEPGIEQVDVLAVLQAARTEMELKKQAYLEKASLEQASLGKASLEKK